MVTTCDTLITLYLLPMSLCTAHVLLGRGGGESAEAIMGMDLRPHSAHAVPAQRGRDWTGPHVHNER